VSKAEVRDRLSPGDRTFITGCLRIMTARTADRVAGRAPRAHRWGWGSADTAAGAGALAERVLADKPGYGDRERVVALLARYVVQIAEALRLEAMKKKPELVKAAEVYGVAPRRGRR
jgi:ATP-dependent exoDNAse (exonuclease V) alpha subunit